jgi:DNA (cytosine-5)-methyltransferase 1
MNPSEVTPTMEVGKSDGLAVAIPIHDKATRHGGHSQDRENAEGNGNGLGVVQQGDPMFTVTTGDKHAVATAPAIGWSEELTPSVECAGTIQRGGDGGRHEGVMTPTMAVRRLTPRECERLQGFPDDYTRIDEKTADGPRYKSLGNSMAVPVMRWIGERIAMVEELAQ